MLSSDWFLGRTNQSFKCFNCFDVSKTHFISFKYVSLFGRNYFLYKWGATSVLHSYPRKFLVQYSFMVFQKLHQEFSKYHNCFCTLIVVRLADILVSERSIWVRVHQNRLLRDGWDRFWWFGSFSKITKPHRYRWPITWCWWQLVSLPISDFYIKEITRLQNGQFMWC